MQVSADTCCGQAGVGAPERGVERNSLLEEASRFRVALWRPELVSLSTAQPQVVGTEIPRGPALRQFEFLGLQAHHEGRNDGSHHLVLEREDVQAIAVEALGPQVVAPRSVDELGSDAHPIADLAHTALGHIPDAQLPADALTSMALPRY
jgi:hypothetical protein